MYYNFNLFERERERERKFNLIYLRGTRKENKQ